MRITAFSCFYCSIIFVSLGEGLSFEADSLSSGQSLQDGDTLVSSGKSFELGFCSRGGSKKRYLGIWYKMTPETVVWVANRDNPLADSSGVVTFGHGGNLVLLNQSKGVVWSSNSSGLLTNPAARILESGNLVLWDNIASNPLDAYSWQSFDYPCNTLLAGMKLGSNLRTGFKWYLSAWKSMDDPSPSEYTSRLNDEGLPQMLILRNGSTKTFRSGMWNGVQFSGLSVGANSISSQMLVDTQTDVYFVYQALNDEIITRVSLNESGTLQRLVREKESADWHVMYTIPSDPCDNYALCGANGFCRSKRYSRCECLRGFIPKSLEEWQMLYFSGGCTRKAPVNCSKGEWFSKLSGVKLPDLVDYSLNKSMSLEECKIECLKNCSCTAFANSDVRGGGSGCLMWFAELIDVSDFEDASYEQDLYIRLAASELDSFPAPSKKRKLVTTVVASAISGSLFLGITLGIAIWKRGIKMAGLRNDIDLPLFDLDTIAAATYNFSPRNLIGAGGFGSVYKGNLSTDQEIAVKRLSKDSGQGLEEFRNEVALIARLQHRNLVSLIGCCIDRDERMLIYEYMPNKSLNNFIFDHDKRFLLAWDRRFEIIIGIGRGILYLHQDSKLQVVHRDLKTSNILLDANLNPKISDFGLARIFGGDEKEARTRRIIGTYGYMSPEYAFDGKFSIKSDVFSFGVLLLEVVSGKRNRGFYHPSHHHNLLGHAWILWNEHRAFEIMDDSIADSSIISQVERCVHVGLLCVQRIPGDRPTMSSVVFMLANDEAILPHPKPPGFFMERSPTNSGATSSRDLYTDNLITITIPEGR